MNNQKFDRTTSIGEIVAAFPQSSDFFKKYKIDFWCGGTRSLAQAISDRKLEEEEFLEELEQFYQKNIRSVAESDELTSSIIECTLITLFGEKTYKGNNLSIQPTNEW